MGKLSRYTKKVSLIEWFHFNWVEFFKSIWIRISRSYPQISLGTCSMVAAETYCSCKWQKQERGRDTTVLMKVNTMPFNAGDSSNYLYIDDCRHATDSSITGTDYWHWRRHTPKGPRQAKIITKILLFPALLPKICCTYIELHRIYFT